MSLCVVDASVVVKWFVAEDHSDLATSVLRNNDLIAPDLLWAEVGNIIWKKVNRRELAETDAYSVLDLFLKAPVATYNSAAIITGALDIAIETGRTVCDCLYVALAAAKGCTMITADRRLFNALIGTRYSGLVEWIGDLAAGLG